MGGFDGVDEMVCMSGDQMVCVCVCVCVVGVGGRGRRLVCVIVLYRLVSHNPSVEGAARSHVNMRTRVKHGIRSNRLFRPN